MSGGHFDYQQHHIQDIIRIVERIINNNENDELDEWGDVIGWHFSPEIMAEIEKGLDYLKKAYIYAQRIDWLMSGDDGPESFLRRLKEELDQHREETK